MTSEFTILVIRGLGISALAPSSRAAAWMGVLKNQGEPRGHGLGALLAGLLLCSQAASAAAEDYAAKAAAGLIGSTNTVKHYESYMSALSAAEVVADLPGKAVILSELKLYSVSKPEELKATYRALDAINDDSADDNMPLAQEQAWGFLVEQMQRFKGPAYDDTITALLKEATAWLPPGPFVEFHTGMATKAARMRLSKLAALMNLAAENRVAGALPILRKLEEKTGTLGPIARGVVVKFRDPADLDRYIAGAEKHFPPPLTGFGLPGLEKVIKAINETKSEEQRINLIGAVRSFWGEEVRAKQLELLNSKDAPLQEELYFGILETVRHSRGNPSNQAFAEAMLQSQNTFLRGGAIRVATEDQNAPWAFELVLGATNEKQPLQLRKRAVSSLDSFGCRSENVAALRLYSSDKDRAIREIATFVLQKVLSAKGCEGME